MTTMNTYYASIQKPSCRTRVCLLGFFVLCLSLTSTPVNAQSGDQVEESDTPSLDSFWYGAYVSVREEGVRIDRILVEMPSIPVRERDVIMKVDGRAVQTKKDLTQAFEGAETGEPVELVVLRDEKRVRLRFDRPDPSTLPSLRLEAME